MLAAVDRLLDGRALLRPRSKPVKPERSKAVQADVFLAPRNASAHADHVLVHDRRGGGGDLAPALIVGDELHEVLLRRSLQRHHELHVLVRNKRSPRLRRWFERNALSQTFELTNEAPG